MRARAVVERLSARGETLALAESLTGGLVADAVVSVPGASRVFAGGAVVYWDSAKENVLDVSAHTLKTLGAVSGRCAAQMARGAKKIYRTTYALSATGYAGPGGDAGLVYLALAWPGGTRIRRIRLFGTRENNRRMAALVALNMLMAHLNKEK